MRTLVLIRHGHAIEGADDFARPLSSAGRSALAARATDLAAFTPGEILCSPAVRTLQTAELLLEALTTSQVIATEEALYLASLSGLLEVLNGVDNSVHTLWVVGHNPGLSELGTHLLGNPIALSPGDYCALSCDVSDWAEFETAPCLVSASAGASP